MNLACKDIIIKSIKDKVLITLYSIGLDNILQLNLLYNNYLHVNIVNTSIEKVKIVYFQMQHNLQVYKYLLSRTFGVIVDLYGLMAGVLVTL